jgi:hypothetical protein
MSDDNIDSEYNEWDSDSDYNSNNEIYYNKKDQDYYNEE